MTNIRKFAFWSLLTLVFTLSSIPAGASPFYLFGKLGSTDVDIRIEDAFDQILDGDDDSQGLGLGLRLGRHFAFEAEYHDFGTVPGLGALCEDPDKPCPITLPIEAETEGYSVSVLPQWPVSERFFVYGKAGIISWETELSEVLPDVERTLDDVDDEDVVYGAGVRFLLPGPLGIFAEFERFADTFETFSLGATLGF